MLHLAVALVMFLTHEAPTTSASPAQDPALYEATVRCDVEALRGLLAKKRDDLDRTDATGNTLVHTAVVLCEPAVVTLLIGAGASVDGAGGVDTHTPLMMASMGGKVAMVDALIAAKADVNRVALDTTAMALAVSNNQLAVIVALARAAASPAHPTVVAATRRASPTTRALVDLCAEKGRDCSLDILLEAAPTTPPAGWWRSAAPCESPTTFARDGDVVRCGCASAFHGPYAELYPGTTQPLVLGHYRAHKRHGVWTTFTKAGSPVERTTWFEGAALRVERLGDAVIPPVAPGPWLSQVELYEADRACATDGADDDASPATKKAPPKQPKKTAAP